MELRPLPTDAVPAGRRFELVRTLGVGSFGTVYLAEMESAGGFRRKVALKLLNPTWDPASDASTRLRDEARLLGRLDHRHIVRVDDLLRLDGRWALVMEYVEGVDLEAVVAPPAGASAPLLPVRAVLEIGAAVAAALRVASESPGDDGRPLAVVHRDIKPSNVRLTAHGDVKVLDFGVARADFVGREAKTERVRYGSLGYMAPERLLGGEETSAGDVYALAVVLYELALRQSYGRSELAEAAQLAQVERAVAAVAPVLGQEVAALLGTMLAYDPLARPTAHQVEARLLSVSAGSTGPALAVWCAAAVPSLGRQLVVEETTVRGRVLAESDLSGRAIVNSATLALPLDADGAFPGAPETARSGSAATIDLQAMAEEPPARVGGPLRAAWLVGALTAFGLVVGLGYVLYNAEKDPRPVVAAVPAQSAPSDLPRPAPPSADATGSGAPSGDAPPSESPGVTGAAGSPAIAGSGAPVATPAAKPAVVAGKPAVGAKVAGSAAPEVVAPEAASPPPAPVERLRSAKFALVGASAPLDVTCGDVHAAGSGNVLMQSFPAGTCTVRSGDATTTVSVQEPRKVDCTLDGGTLQCR